MSSKHTWQRIHVGISLALIHIIFVPPASSVPLSRRAYGTVEDDVGIGLISFFTALSGAFVMFSVQVTAFLLLRNKVARVFKPKTYLVPEQERVDSPPDSCIGLLRILWSFDDWELIRKCGLDAYFFLRYLKTLLVIFVPTTVCIMPVLLYLNFADGKGLDLNSQDDRTEGNPSKVTGLDTLAWGNIRPEHSHRYTVHLFMALLVVLWVCIVFVFEMRVYIKVRHDYLTSAEHRRKASARTILVCSIPRKWLSDEALRGLLDAFPGGVRNVWLNRDLSGLLDKISRRNAIHLKLESAETELIRTAKKAQVRKRNDEETKGRLANGLGPVTRCERAARDAREDAKAHRTACLGHQARSRDRAEKVRLDLRDAITRVGRGVQEGLQTANGFKPLPHQTNPRSSASVGARRRNLAGKATFQAPVIGGNTVRRQEDDPGDLQIEATRWWQFWEPPSGSYMSPIPQGWSPEESHLTPLWKQIVSSVQRLGAQPLSEKQSYGGTGYPPAFNPDYERQQGERMAVWEKYLHPSDRPTHRLPPFGVAWLPALPFIGRQVDTISWCREQLARLNVEIEQDQSQCERFPLMNSAFIQFNHQVAAHMACQCQIHHIPRYMAPRFSEISPRDVIWSNMALGWWQVWYRTAIVAGALLLMTALWALPVAFTAALGQLDQLLQSRPWLSPIRDNTALAGLAKSTAGVLPAAIMALLLFAVPSILDVLASFRGAKTGTQKAEFVQTFYFIFLFTQVFLVVSVASSATLTLNGALESVQKVHTASDVLDLLATNLPRAANYFFSYMVLQALSTGSSTLVQAGALLRWFVVSRIHDDTARQKWTRNTKLESVRWGTIFPVYTNFACIALVYCVIAPLISIFAVVTFGVLWLAQRYTMLYVARFEHDSGGVMYPRAINQTFAGVYIMELCVAGLYFLVEDENGMRPCVGHGIGMILAFALTGLFQILLNRSFSPLFRSLPITFEDEAILRDEALCHAGSSPHHAPALRFSDTPDPTSSQSGQKRAGGLEAATWRTLYRDVSNEREISVTDPLAHEAFEHEALRAYLPAVWIPRDDLGISKDEIRQTRNFSREIWITDEGTALDSKTRVIYGQNPPDY